MINCFINFAVGCFNSENDNQHFTANVAQGSLKHCISASCILYVKTLTGQKLIYSLMYYMKLFFYTMVLYDTHLSPDDIKFVLHEIRLKRLDQTRISCSIFGSFI